MAAEGINTQAQPSVQRIQSPTNLFGERLNESQQRYFPMKNSGVAHSESTE